MKERATAPSFPLIMVGVILLSGCAARPDPKSCHTWQPTSVTALECAAARGDKAAMRDLGRRYETGDAVTADVKRAVKLYKAAAVNTGSSTPVYVPPVGKVAGYVMLVPQTPSPGDPLARLYLALMYLDGRGVKPDPEKAIKLLKAAQNLPEARALLEAIPFGKR